MQKHNYLIGAAVTAAIMASSAQAAVPTPAAAAGSSYTLVIAGSSAAQSSVANAIENDLCGGAGNTLLVESNAPSNANKNFYAYSCNTATAIAGVSPGTLVTFYYRSEGGSVVGALPIATGKQVLRLNLNDASCTAATVATTAGAAVLGSCTVTGVTSTNGPNDSWSGAVVEDFVQLGVTDVEPAQFGNSADYPSNYNPSVFGTASPAQLAGLSKSRALQQVFGLAVNTSGLALNTAANGTGVHLSRESVANILSQSYTDWSTVPDALTGAPITTSPAPITRIDREPGSGTRTATNIYFFGYGCGSSTAITNYKNEALNYATGDELNAANAQPGAIAYASIDNLLLPKNTSYTNLVLATLNGVTASTLTAASGAYDFWYEATLVPNAGATTGNSASLSTWLQGDVQKFTTAPVAADINAIPNLNGNVGTVPLTSRSSGTTTIYINPYTRLGNSCNVPSETN
jgi:hypothetical protein